MPDGIQSILELKMKCMQGQTGESLQGQTGESLQGQTGESLQGQTGESHKQSKLS